MTLDAAPAAAPLRPPSAPARCAHGVLVGRPCYSCTFGAAPEPVVRVVCDECEGAGLVDVYDRHYAGSVSQECCAECRGVGTVRAEGAS